MERLVPLSRVTRHVEALKLRLAAMEADALSLEETAAMAEEISAIRLQLKRLRLDQAAMVEAVRRLDDERSSVGPFLGHAGLSVHRTEPVDRTGAV